MKFIYTVILSAFTWTIYAQATDSLDPPSNSFEKRYRSSNPSLAYSYDPVSQVHNYSDNWDFDKDGIKDEVYFVGTGGAHVYYFLKMVLSVDRKSREFNFIQSDFPLLTATDTLNLGKTLSGFVVAEVGKDLEQTIIVRLDDSSYYAGKKEFTKHKIRTRNISVCFEKGKAKYGSL